jgi:hypothetical protein
MPRRIDKLRVAFRARYGELQVFFNLPPEDAVTAKRYNDNSYLIPMMRDSMERTFRRFLAERNFALEYAQCYPGELNTSGIGNRRTIGTFVEELESSQQELVREAITTGIRFLAIERSFSPPLPGLSALIALINRDCTQTKVVHIVELFNSPEMSDIKKLAAKASFWLEQAQQYYDSQLDERYLGKLAVIPSEIVLICLSIATNKADVQHVWNVRDICLKPSKATRNG